MESVQRYVNKMCSCPQEKNMDELWPSMLSVTGKSFVLDGLGYMESNTASNWLACAHLSGEVSEHSTMEDDANDRLQELLLLMFTYSL